MIESAIAQELEHHDYKQGCFLTRYCLRIPQQKIISDARTEGAQWKHTEILRGDIFFLRGCFCGGAVLTPEHTSTSTIYLLLYLGCVCLGFSVLSTKKSYPNETNTMAARWASSEAAPSPVETKKHPREVLPELPRRTAEAVRDSAHLVR